jgi:hypothetical protein
MLDIRLNELKVKFLADEAATTLSTWTTIRRNRKKAMTVTMNGTESDNKFLKIAFLKILREIFFLSPNKRPPLAICPRTISSMGVKTRIGMNISDVSASRSPR